MYEMRFYTWSKNFRKGDLIENDMTKVWYS